MKKTIISGLVIMAIGFGLLFFLFKPHLVGIACIGCGLLPLGFLITVGGLYVRQRNFKADATRDYWLSRQNLEAAAKKEREMAKQKAKPAPRKRSGIIFSNRVEVLSNSLHTILSNEEKGYDTNLKVHMKLTTAYEYVVRDYPWFNEHRDDVPSIKFDILKENLEAAEIFLNEIDD